MVQDPHAHGCRVLCGPRRRTSLRRLLDNLPYILPSCRALPFDAGKLPYARVARPPGHGMRDYVLAVAADLRGTTSRVPIRCESVTSVLSPGADGGRMDRWIVDV